MYCPDVHWGASCRGYSEKKLQENMQCEIMNVLLEEAMESYK